MKFNILWIEDKPTSVKSQKNEIENYLKEKGFSYVIYKRVNDLPLPEYVKLIIGESKPLFSYGPVESPERPQKEQFSLYKL